MASIDTIVNVTVDRQTSAVTTNGYNLAMFLGLHKGFPERYRVYTDIDGVANDFAVSSNEYKAAAIAFSQEVSSDRFAIGRQDSTTVTYTPTVANSTTYTVKLGTASYTAVTFTFISDASATAAEIVTGLTALINADVTLPVTASGSTTLILTGDSGATFSALASENLVPVYATTESLTNALAAIALENQDWYGLLGYSHVKADQLELAAYAQANRKFYATSSSDVNIINQSFSVDTTSIAKALNASSYDRAFLLYSNDTAKFPEAGVLSTYFGFAPGAATLKFKTINGIVVDNLTSTQVSNALAKKANVFVPITANGGDTGTKIVEEGTVSEGTFADIIRDLDYAASDIQTSVYSGLINLPKVPFTKAGFAVIEGAIRNSVLRSVDMGIFSEDEAPIVDMPTPLEISANDRALRKLTGIKVTARMAGSIHYVSCLLTATI